MPSQVTMTDQEAVSTAAAEPKPHPAPVPAPTQLKQQQGRPPQAAAAAQLTVMPGGQELVVQGAWGLVLLQ
jgi:hypothetical protein